MNEAGDVTSLFESVGTLTYHEIVADERLAEAMERWPLLRLIGERIEEPKAEAAGPRRELGLDDPRGG